MSAWSHCAGLLRALPGTLLLWRRSSGDRPAKRLCLLVFGLSLASCYAASTLIRPDHMVKSGGGRTGLGRD